MSLDLEATHIIHILIAMVIVYVALRLRTKYEKNLTLVYLDRDGHIENVDPPYEINVKEDSVTLYDGYRADKVFCKKDMIFLLVKPVSDITDDLKNYKIWLEPWKINLKVKESY